MANLHASRYWKALNVEMLYSVLLFSKLNKMFLDTLIRKIFYYIMKINNYRGDLTDISAKNEALAVLYVSNSKYNRLGML